MGGETLEAALDAARKGARVIVCGAMSQYELPGEEYYGVKNLGQVGGVGRTVLRLIIMLAPSKALYEYGSRLTSLACYAAGSWQLERRFRCTARI